jgi:hypothetical protein
MSTETKAERMARVAQEFLCAKGFGYVFDDGPGPVDEDLIAAMQAALDAEEPGECPPTHIPVELLVGAYLTPECNGGVAVREIWSADDALDRKWAEVDLRAYLAKRGAVSMGKATVWLLKPAPVADLGVVVAGEVS